MDHSFGLGENWCLGTGLWHVASRVPYPAIMPRAPESSATGVGAALTIIIAISTRSFTTFFLSIVFDLTRFCNVPSVFTKYCISAHALNFNTAIKC